MTRFDAAAADRFLDALRAALADGDAADYAGVSLDTIGDWRTRRRTFDADVRRVKGARAFAAAGVVQAAAGTNWRAAMALAEVATQDRELDRLRALTTDADR